MKFIIEQIAIVPPNPAAAIELLSALGLDEWVHDIVNAGGTVFGAQGTNEAALAFNYQAASPNGKLEFEVLYYRAGPSWMDRHGPSASHLGMHCSAEDLESWRAKFKELGIDVAQEVFTTNHTNVAIAGKRWYQYVIFNTRAILGVDLKFIVRRDAAPIDNES
jgi:hypothetical protein